MNSDKLVKSSKKIQDKWLGYYDESTFGSEIADNDIGYFITQDIEQLVEEHLDDDGLIEEYEVFNPNKDLLIEINEQLFNKTDSSLKKYLTRRKSRISTNFVEILIPMEKIDLFTGELLAANKLLIFPSNFPPNFDQIEQNFEVERGLLEATFESN